MSCPSSLKSAGAIFGTDDECVDLPNEYYVYTALMIGLVVGIAMLYRQLWVTIWGLISYYRRPKHLRGGPAGCKPVGKFGDRNLSKETRARGHSNGHANGDSSGRIEALFIHPIKSCYPVEVESSMITEMGLEFDRQFCFASWHEPMEKDQAKSSEAKKGSSAYWDSRPHWEFMTQRQNPSLTRLKVQVWRPDSELKDYSENSEIVKSSGCLVVSFDFAPPMTSIHNIWSVILSKIKAFDLSAVPVWTFQLPLEPTTDQIEDNGYTSETVRIWRDAVGVIDMTSEIPKEMLSILHSLFLEDAKHRSASKYARIKNNRNTLRLFRVDDARQRQVYKCAPTKAQLGYQPHTGFQDSVRLSIPFTL
jgi:hypothetical protein